MELHNFNELTIQAQNNRRPKTVAFVSAADQHIIKTAVMTRKNGIAQPVLIGNKAQILVLLDMLHEDSSLYPIYDADTPIAAGQLAVTLVRENKVNMLMKGMMETSDFLRPIVNRETGIGTGRIMSHVALQSIPGYHKLVVNTDAAMCANPDLKQKKEILLNAVETLHRLGYEFPKVACLCCKETPDKKIQETMDARELQEMCERGELGSCYVCGPISYDIALSKEIAALKHFQSPHCGDFDVLLQPNIHAGNILGKCLEVTCKASMAGIVVGAQVPIILTSRGAEASEKINSIAFAAAITE